MRFFILILTSLLFLHSAYGRMVEFSVNMNNEAVNLNGVHVSGDFQIAAGYTGGNWNPATTLLTQIGTTGIYHVYVNIPAKKKYEYKYVNGDQFYESEYVPDESRVGYMFNDNRWFYLDSLANDTLKLPALVFATNAPRYLKLLRFKVGMTGMVVDAKGVHVAGSHNSFNTETSYMYSFDGKVYEYLAYIDSLTGSADFRFINGNSTAGYETVPAACSFSSNRSIVFAKDTVMKAVCFSSCSACFNGIKEKINSGLINITPNPMTNSTTLQCDQAIEEVNIFTLEGRLVRTYTHIENKLLIEKGELEPGIYLVKTNKNATSKLIIQ